MVGNGIPGPGQYKIQGFAEKIAADGIKISRVREQNRKNREMREMEMKIRKGQIDIDNEKNIEKHNKVEKDDGKMILKISDTDNEDDAKEE